MATRRKKQLVVAAPEPQELATAVEHEFDARHYQADLFAARRGETVLPTGGLDAKGRFVGCNGWDEERGPCDRFLAIWHRRAGKDRTGMELIRDEMQSKIGSYWHLYPLQVQAKRAIWNAVDNATETRLLELVFPLETREDTNNQDLFIRFKDGNTYQLCGSDAYDRLVGANPRGVLFSEWALCDPRAWAYIMPIVVENGGWAAFITTYRGRNHAYQMAQKLRLDPRWYIDVRPITHTKRQNGERVVRAEAVEDERQSLTALHGRTRADAMIREEFYCDPMAALPGAIYGGSVASMLAEGRA